MDSSLFDLTGRKALITGGAIGIGRSCAMALARAGADVAIADTNVTVGARTVEAIRAIGRDAMVIRCDVTKPEEVTAMVDVVATRFGRLDVAVNNAGIYRYGDDETQSLDDWQDVMGVNLTGTWLCARAEMRQMVKQSPTEGKIINIGSIGGSSVASNGSYDASKAGVIHLTRVLAAHWGRYNINVNSVSPGKVIAAIGTTRSLQERQHLRALTPLGHVQRLEDLHGPIVFLASKGSDYVTGQDIVVDGGHTLATWFKPLERSVPPRVSPSEEVGELLDDLDARGIVHDDDGIIS